MRKQDETLVFEMGDTDIRKEMRRKFWINRPLFSKEKNPQEKSRFCVQLSISILIQMYHEVFAAKKLAYPTFSQPILCSKMISLAT